MKTILIALLTFFSTMNISYGQYGVDGAIYGAEIAAIKAAELHKLRQIRKKQDRIALYVEVLAAETFALVELEEKFLESLTAISPILNEMKGAVNALLEMEKLYYMQQQIVELASQTPELTTAATRMETEIILEALSLLEYGLTATTDSEEDHMTHKTRIDILNTVEKGLLKLNQKSEKLYGILRVASLSNNFKAVESLVIDISNYEQE